MRSDSRRLQNPSPSLFPFPTIMAMLKEQVTLLMQQIQVLQNQLSAWTLSPPVDLPPPPTTTKLPKITAPLHSQVCKMTLIASRQSAACTYAYEGPRSPTRQARCYSSCHT